MHTVNAIAARWNTDRKFVYNLIATGQLRALKLGAPGAKRPMIRVPVDALEAFERAQAVNTEAA